MEVFASGDGASLDWSCEAMELVGVVSIIKLFFRFMPVLCCV